MTRPRRLRRALTFLTAALLAGVGLLAAPQSATADGDGPLYGGYSLDCSGEVPVLSFSGEITGDNEGHTTGTTNIYFTLQGPSGTQEFGPKQVSLPSTYTDLWNLTDGSAKYTFGLRRGDGPRGDDLQSVSFPDDCVSGSTSSMIQSGASFGDAYCTDDGGAAADVVVSTTPPVRNVKTYVTVNNGVYPLPVEGLTGPDGTYTKTVPIPKNGTTNITAGIKLASGQSVYGGDRDYTFPDVCATPTPTPTPTTEPTSSPSPTATPTDTPPPSPSESSSPLSVSLSTSTVIRGSQVTLTASGFASGETAEIWLHSTPTKLVTATADENGTVRQTVTIAEGTAIGAHKIEVRGASSGSTFANLTVTDGLAVTGFDSSTTVATGVGASVLLLGGIAFVLLARRRPARRS
ncbi:LPXTG cell wall anchor domain-containing protein [Microbacterium sp. RURRCA19A]|uniref:LPXTG cell wall anchor domain-containing protein n=1 Tax=Microbacterium sp. RURRCA19A TaxID=1907391 RepID=UPI000956C8C1|nr:LPXTG cell wall anchor domain-containing protein [Microbacterium sp. RURRCA19A]SIS10730.1 LPXTG-motif cell wall anchor domain-containing protein [Microbacterium sp. RURRCA19A]